MTHNQVCPCSAVYRAPGACAGLTLDSREKRIGIIGENGGGKSSLVRLINGLSQATEGTVSYDGINVAKHAKEFPRQVRIIFSDADNQIVMPTVAEDIEFRYNAIS